MDSAADGNAVQSGSTLADGLHDQTDGAFGGILVDDGERYALAGICDPQNNKLSGFGFFGYVRAVDLIRLNLIGKRYFFDDRIKFYDELLKELMEGFSFH